MEPDFYYRQIHSEVHASNYVSANFKDRKKKNYQHMGKIYYDKIVPKM